MAAYGYNISGDKNVSLLMGDMFHYDNPLHLMANDTSSTNVTNNQTEIPFIYPIIRQPIHMIVIYSLAYSIVFVLGLTGNGLVVSIVYRNPRMHNVTNYFIVNLAIADILVLLLCLPITLMSNLYSGTCEL